MSVHIALSRRPELTKNHDYAIFNIFDWGLRLCQATSALWYTSLFSFKLSDEMETVNSPKGEGIVCRS